MLEALPTILLGVAVYWILPNGPAHVKWLKPQEREWLEGELAKDSRKVAAHGLHGLGAGLRNPNVWALFASKFANGLAVFTVGLWLPQRWSTPTSTTATRRNLRRPDHGVAEAVQRMDA